MIWRSASPACTGVRSSAKFEQGDWTILPSDVPALSNSLVTFDCRVDDILEVGTHSIFVGLITEAHFGESGDPLVYCNGAFASLVPLCAVTPHEVVDAGLSLERKLQ